VGVLGALDDKIELNRRMNRTLEAIGRAIFKSWFVDFDPVHANARGRSPRPLGEGKGEGLPGLDPATAALFPDRFTESPPGPIPAGWEASRIKDEFRLTMGQSPPGETYNEEGGGLPFFQGRTDFGFRFPKRRVFCTAPNRLAEPGDTLVSVRAPVGDINMATERCCVGRGVAAIRHNSGSRSYTYYAMQALREEFVAFEAHGTVFGAMGRKDFENVRCLRPPAQMVAKFDQLVSPIDDRIAGAERESATLASMRDALLPKLLSGELRVGQAEQLVGEVVE
jgi:type I restriction enzyme, S subunit